MPKQIIIAEQHRLAAVFWEDQIQELVVATGNQQVSDVYLGVVENVLPGIDAAFVNIGEGEKNGFIHVTDLGPLRLKRNAGAITELLEPQQKVLVQVMKEPTGNKGPRLTGNVSLPGRYLVLMPYGRGVNLSRRIKSETERNRLRALAILVKPAGMGLLVRTEAEGKAEEAIIEDLETLQKQWEAIQQEAKSTRAPALLNRDDDFIQRVLRDMYTADVNRIVVDSHTGLKRVKQHLMGWSGGRNPEGVLIDHHRDRLPILEYFRVNAAIREALKPRVDLPSGGYIIIEPTEALTVIDVNSGSFTRSATARETVLWTNCEAATEIARQLRLRNIAGVIIVDFIDMDARRDQLQVLEHFNKALKADKARPQIAQLSELGLVELTRKRQGQNIYELFSQTCPTCGGLGHQVHLPGESDRTVARETVEVGGYRDDVSPMGQNLATKAIAPPVSGIERSRPPVNEPVEIAAERDYQDFDLVNHPSYQEQTLGNNRRRRRPREGDAISPTPLPSSTAIASPRSIPTRDDSLKPNPRSIPSVSFTPSRIKPLKSETDDNNPVTEERPNGFSSGDREKPQRHRSPRPEMSPLEVISVEMTPMEQDVYALMGISPLVRLDREIPNPKSVIVSVIAPGEAPTVEAVETATVEQEVEAPTVEAVETATVEREVEAPTVEVEQEVEAPLEAVEPIKAEPIDLTPEATDSGQVTRRRRRRSSALESEASVTGTED